MLIKKLQITNFFYESFSFSLFKVKITQLITVLISSKNNNQHIAYSVWQIYANEQRSTIVHNITITCTKK